eukprot:6458758-Amphidinium_carterae.1
MYLLRVVLSRSAHMRSAHSSSSVFSWGVHAASSHAALAAFKVCTDMSKRTSTRVSSAQTTGHSPCNQCGDAHNTE